MHLALIGTQTLLTDGLSKYLLLFRAYGLVFGIKLPTNLSIVNSNNFLKKLKFFDGLFHQYNQINFNFIKIISFRQIFCRYFEFLNVSEGAASNFQFFEYRQKYSLMKRIISLVKLSTNYPSIMA